jgi:hypothetical protein
VILVLLVPFTFLPAILWWIIPLGILAAVVVHHRPARWAWPLLLLPFAWVNANYELVNGTPTIWIAAFVALSTVRPWMGALVLIKPSVFPFALAGIRDRRWWISAAILVALCLPMTETYVRVLLNSDGGLLYSLVNVPLLSISVVAWASRRRDRDRLVARPTAGRRAGITPRRQSLRADRLDHCERKHAGGGR